MYSSIASSILMPTKMSMKPRPYFRYLKYFATAARAKYIALRPRIAKILLVSTMKGSRLTENTAGMLSTAKATSVVSMTMRATKRGVAFLVKSEELRVKSLVSGFRFFLSYEEFVAVHFVGDGEEFLEPLDEDVF